MGKTTPFSTGFINLFKCQAAAIGPVSASPSPIKVVITRFGLSKTAPKAVESE